MTSKYSASIKVRLSRTFNWAVLIGSILLCGLVVILFVYFESILVGQTEMSITAQQQHMI